MAEAGVRTVAGEIRALRALHLHPVLDLAAFCQRLSPLVDNLPIDPVGYDQLLGGLATPLTGVTFHLGDRISILFENRGSIMEARHNLWHEIGHALLRHEPREEERGAAAEVLRQAFPTINLDSPAARMLMAGTLGLCRGNGFTDPQEADAELLADAAWAALGTEVTMSGPEMAESGRRLAAMVGSTNAIG